jgi:exosome complex component RRP41
MAKSKATEKYDKRFDGRKDDECRAMEAKVGVIPNADGSAMFKTGNTVALAAVYGPRELHPRKIQNVERGIVRVSYQMMPFSGHGNRVRPGLSRRSKEIQLVIEQSLMPVLDLKAYPKAVIDIIVQLPQTDAGTRCAAITAASMALADAGIKMKQLVSAVAVGKVGHKICADVTYDEEAFKGEGGSTDIPIAMLSNSKDLTLLQMDGEITQKELKAALKMGEVACDQITEIQVKALKEKYQ